MLLNEKASCHQRTCVFSNETYQKMQDVRHKTRELRLKAMTTADTKTDSLHTIGAENYSRASRPQLLAYIKVLQETCRDAGRDLPPFPPVDNDDAVPQQKKTRRSTICGHCHSTNHLRKSDQRCPCHKDKGGCDKNPGCLLKKNKSSEI